MQDKQTAKRARFVMNVSEAESEYGQRLLNLLLDICHDGILKIDEVERLHMLLRNDVAGMPSVDYLRSITREIVADGSVDEVESYRLKKAILRVAPKGVRGVFADHLSQIGLPDPAEPLGQPRWRFDEATERQLDLIVRLGGQTSPKMSKGDASDEIERLLENRGPSARQIMVLRFFDRMDLLSTTKDEVCLWMDTAFHENPRLELAWAAYKRETAMDPRDVDYAKIPIGEYRKYIKKQSFLRRLVKIVLGNRTS
jgi:hypothetical protein